MQSNGGPPTRGGRACPLALVESGPAAGVAGAVRAAKRSARRKSSTRRRARRRVLADRTPAGPRPREARTGSRIIRAIHWSADRRYRGNRRWRGSNGRVDDYGGLKTVRSAGSTPAAPSWRQLPTVTDATVSTGAIDPIELPVGGSASVDRRRGLAADRLLLRSSVRRRGESIDQLLPSNTINVPSLSRDAHMIRAIRRWWRGGGGRLHVGGLARAGVNVLSFDVKREIFSLGDVDRLSSIRIECSFSC